jgi:DNA-binding NtrC family response regulator
MTPNSTLQSEGQRLLIVDDEVELRSLLAMKFSKSGFEVDVAATGEEAIEFMNSSDYKAILCDLNLSESMKGGDLHKLVISKKISSKFIAITGYAQDSPEVRAARAEGMKYVFSKPLQIRAILSLIEDSK